MERYVTTETVAEVLGMSSRTIAKMAREGRIPAHPVTGAARRTWRYRLSEVEAHFSDIIRTGVQTPAESDKQ
jgi:excisionase family DNA binding protein